jgi:hypothetical protein
MSFLKCCCSSGSTSDNEMIGQKEENLGKQNPAFESDKGSSQSGEKQLHTENAHVVPNISTDGKKAQMEELTQIEVKDDSNDIPNMEH